MTPRQLMGGSQAAAGFLFPPVTVRFVDSPRPKEAARAQRSRIKRALYGGSSRHRACVLPQIACLPFLTQLYYLLTKDIQKVHSTEFKENYQMGPLQCRPDIPQGQVSLSGYQSKSKQ